MHLFLTKETGRVPACENGSEESWLFCRQGRNEQANFQTKITSIFCSAATELGSDSRGRLITDGQVSTSEVATSPQPGLDNSLNLLQCEIKWIRLHHC